MALAIVLSEGSENGANIDRSLIPNNALKKALDEELAIVGPSFRDLIYENLERAGLDLHGEEAKYSLEDVRKHFRMIFGEDAAELLLERLSKKLST